MKLVRYIKDIIYVTRVLNNEKVFKELVDKNINIDNVLKITKLRYKNKNSYIRNSIALIVRKIRKEKPYKIQDYSKAKELYDSRTPIDLSKVKPGDYVYKISREEPVKGKRYCEYYINESGTEGVYKIYKWNDGYKYWSVEDYTGNTNTFGNALDEESSRSFRFATKEEVQEFKNRRKNKTKEFINRQTTKRLLKRKRCTNL